MSWSPSGVSTTIGTGSALRARGNAQTDSWSSAVLIRCNGLTSLGMGRSRKILSQESPSTVRLPEFLVQPETESSVVATRFLDRELSPKGERVMGLLMFLAQPTSSKRARMLLQSALCRRSGDLQSRMLTGTEVVGSSSLS